MTVGEKIKEIANDLRDNDPIIALYIAEKVLINLCGLDDKELEVTVKVNDELTHNTPGAKRLRKAADKPA